MINDVSVLKVLISCPGDIVEEKLEIEKILHKWNRLNVHNTRKIFLPVRWDIDSYSEAGESPQEILNKQIVDSSDLLIGIFWTRMGTKTKKFDSGTVEEIESFISSGKHVMLFFCKKSVDIDSVDLDQYNRLKKFKENLKDRCLYFVYNNLADFSKMLFEQLSLKYSKENTINKIKKINEKHLSDEDINVINCILEYNNRNNNPKVEDMRHRMGIEKIRLRDVLNTLVKWKYIEALYVSGKEPVYRVLSKGRQVSD